MLLKTVKVANSHDGEQVILAVYWFFDHARVDKPIVRYPDNVYILNTKKTSIGMTIASSDTCMITNGIIIFLSFLQKLHTYLE